MIEQPIRYLTLGEVFELHRQVVSRWGGSAGLRDLGSLEGDLACALPPPTESLKLAAICDGGAPAHRAALS